MAYITGVTDTPFGRPDGFTRLALMAQTADAGCRGSRVSCKLFPFLETKRCQAISQLR
jgi:hypothetical protein